MFVTALLSGGERGRRDDACWLQCRLERGPLRLQRHQIHSGSEVFKLFQASRCHVLYSTSILCMEEIVNFIADRFLGGGEGGGEGFQNGHPTAHSWNGVITAKQWAAGARRLSRPIRVLARREAGARKARTWAQAKTNPPALLRGFLKVRHRCHSKELLFRPHRSDHSAVFFHSLRWKYSSALMLHKWIRETFEAAHVVLV